MLTALHTIFRVSPRSYLVGSVWIERDDKGLALRIKMKLAVGPPFRGNGLVPNFDVLEDAAEAHPILVNDPGAVARLQDDRLHAAKMTDHAYSDLGRTWQVAWNSIAVP